MNFDKDVFPQELEELGRRRVQADPAASEGEPAAASDEDLVGLCFSGGGIRSSTFNLGLARGLHRWGLLETVDYLSTVSGGGYIGSHLADLYRTGTQASVLEDAGDETRRREPAGVKRLRQLGRFLTPNGSFGEWLMGIVALLRGTLWNCSIFALVAVALAASFAFGLDASGQWIFPFPHVVATAVAVGVSLTVIMLSVLGQRTPPGGLLVALVVGTLFVAMMDGLPWVLGEVASHANKLTATALMSGLTAVVGSGSLSKLPKALYVLAARLIALILAVVLPVCLFLLLLLHFISETGDPMLLTKQLGSIALLFVFLIVDFNRTSLHGFYKERIGATFLPDDPKLSDFRGKPGPLHLINVALNVPGDDDLDLRDRVADFFTLSCLHVGGPRTGYADTEDLEAAKPDFSVASAVAISGAAASPNMGLFTDALIRPIMAMLNVRMGYWAPNPAELSGDHPRWRWAPRLPSLFREMIGDLRSDTTLVNISDGGHLENFGAYELLRRRCKLIIIGDGGADANVSLGDMAALIRFAQTDLGAEIDIDLDDLRLNEHGHSTKHAALGTVRYDNGRIGRILYLKSSFTGHEPPEVRYYKEVNPAFPNESTADQWFDDAQFDAYRALGEEVVDSLFQQLGYADPSEAAITKDALGERLADLNVVLAPTSRSRSSALTHQLHVVETALMRPALDGYRRQLIPTIHSKPIADEDLNTLVPVVMMQLQLMENAVERLGLIDVRRREALANRGWMNVFQRWAQSDAFCKLSLVCLPSFGANLTQFVDVALGLSTQYAWLAFPAKDQTLALFETNPDHAGMIMGLAEYEGSLDAPRVHRLVMRGGLGGGDRLESAIAAMREGHPRVEFEGHAKVLAGALPMDAYINRAHARGWTLDDERVVKDVTRSEADKAKDKTPGTKAKAPDSADPFAAMLAFDTPRGGGKAKTEAEAPAADPFAAMMSFSAPRGGGKAKADEAKADEAKADEAKADEAKADEAKADEAKPDEAKPPE